MKYFLFLIMIVSASGCVGDDAVSKPINLCSDLNCDKCVLIDRDIFNETETANYSFQEIKIVGDCLKIKYAGGG
ncbi:hypothetical protein SAMN05444483_101349 [Salegentibacter echinorum]|uniref:Lipoprotein n=1 Tax=Salegentibacter echinorum TaxID=1073325 RepID=A0A1M5C5K3_SALEC|nr:hypothetical protein [Salegentibacter echinorum]SHF49960.1 hypothetical protein SAMN05444483_101349 [Salegentibacter echinorum]